MKKTAIQDWSQQITVLKIELLGNEAFLADVTCPNLESLAYEMYPKQLKPSCVDIIHSFTTRHADGLKSLGIIGDERNATLFQLPTHMPLLEDCKLTCVTSDNMTNIVNIAHKTLEALEVEWGLDDDGVIQLNNRLSEVASRELKPNKFCQDKSRVLLGVPVHAPATPHTDQCTNAAKTLLAVTTAPANSKPSSLVHCTALPIQTTTRQVTQQVTVKTTKVFPASSGNVAAKPQPQSPPVAVTTAPAAVAWTTAMTTSNTNNKQCNNNNNKTSAATIISQSATSSTPMDISEEGDNTAAAAPRCQRLQWEQQQLAIRQEEVCSSNNTSTQQPENMEDDQPLDMSKTSLTISHRQHREEQQDDQKQLFSGLYLLVDTAMGLLEQQQANHNIHCNPVVA